MIGNHVVERFVESILIYCFSGIHKIWSEISSHSLSTTINIGLTNRWMARHLSVQKIVFTRNAQISLNMRGCHTAMGFSRLKLLLRFAIRPAQLEGKPPAVNIGSSNNNITELNSYRWKRCCRGLYQLPIAA